MKNLTGLDAYEAGYLNNHGGGNVDWWHDYIRSELDRAHDFYQSQLGGEATRYEVPEGWQLVPVEPTAYQVLVGRNAKPTDDELCVAIYRAMLAAAPKPEAAK